jgi:Protein of unknown function
MTPSDHDHRQRHPAPHAAGAGHRPHHDHHAAHHPHHHATRRSSRRWWIALRRGAVGFLRRRLVRRIFWGATLTVAIVAVAMAGLWWRLSSGPIELDMATPWLKAAIEQNFGGQQTVAVGGTQIERDENGRTSLRLLDIVVRDADGTVVASAPKAEVGISGISLLTGTIRAASLNLVGAEMSVRIETDGRVTVFAGADKRPIATASPTMPLKIPAAQPDKTTDALVPQGALRAGLQDVAGILAWIDGLGATGLDGHDLRELGLKNGNLIVDDQRNGKRWTFSRINVSLTRPAQGGVIFRLASDAPERPWVISAAMRPLSEGVRAVGIEARHVSSSDILLAMRLNEGDIETDLPLSASIRAEISSDGTLLRLQGQVLADEGTIVDRAGENTNLKIDRADIRFNWEAQQRALIIPFQIQSGGNQLTLRATLEAPAEQNGVWLLSVVRGDPVIDPVILASTGKSDEEGIAINRVVVRARIDTVHRRIDLDQGDFGRIDTRPLYNIAVAVTGSLDYSGAEPHLAFGVAGTRMPMAVMKRLWPVFTAVHVREWTEQHISGGVVERVVIAGNAPLANFKANGAPVPDEGLAIDIETSGTTLRPLATLPAIRDADLTVHITGQTATVDLGRGTVEVTPGRKLNIASGVFEVPDTHQKPQPARVRFRIDGTMPAAAALLASEALRDKFGITLDPSSSRGTIAAQVAVKLLLGRDVPKDSAVYSITADLSNFAADKMLLGQKVEAPALRVTASSDGYQITGDAKINGTPATVDLSRKKGDAAAELRLQATIDEAARRRLGIDFGGAVTGTIPVKLATLINDSGKDAPMSVDADLTPVKIDNLLPGWLKPAGKPAHASYTLIKTARSTRFDDLTIAGSGATVKGSLELNEASEIVSANFPVFSVSDGDKVSLKADRGSDGVLHVVMRGDIFDGTNFVKSALAGVPAEKSKQKQPDLDLDIKIATVVGHNGETLRGLDLRLKRRGERIRSFSLNAKIGRDTPLNGDLRLRASDKHQVIFFETDDAGALFRFTDMYPRMFGGQMWVAMDPPTPDRSPQIGTLYIRNFVVRGEPGLDRIVTGAPGQVPGGVEFSEMHCEFTRVAGRMSLRDGVVRGPVVGATIEGQIDYVKNDVHLRGTFVPFYGLNNMFGQIPIVGIFLGGGSNEGLLGITYEATGPPGSPRILVNPVTAIAPGLLRKFIPSPGAFDPKFVPTPR